MFDVTDLNGRPLPELKEIARAFSIDSKGLGKNELIDKIVDAQGENADLARTTAQRFNRNERNHSGPKDMKQREKRPRRVRLDPMSEEPVQAEVQENNEEETPVRTPEPVQE